MAAVTVCSNFGAQENKVSHCFHFFPICLPWSDGTGCHDLSFWKLSFKSTLSLSSFIFIKRLFSSSLLLAIMVVSSAYLRLFIFLPAILIPFQLVLHSAWHFTRCTLHIYERDLSNYIEQPPFPGQQTILVSFPLHWTCLLNSFSGLCFSFPLLNVGMGPFLL